MSEDAKTRKGRRGILGSIGRLFGGGSDRSAEPERAEPPATGAGARPKTAAGGETASAAPAPVGASTPAAAAQDDDEEDALVLGPAYRAAPAEPAGTVAKPDATMGDDSEEELILTGGADASAEDSTKDSTEDELVLSGSAAKDAGEEDAAAALEQHLTEQHLAEQDLAEQDLAEEEDILARMRARLGEAAGEKDTNQNDETPPADDEAGETGGAEAALAPEAGGQSYPFWLLGEDRDDREGTFPASDARPDGREPMEGEEMDRKDETATDEDKAKAEAEQPATALFPGAMHGAGEDDAGKDDSDLKAIADEPVEPGEESAEESVDDFRNLPDMNDESDPETEAMVAAAADVEPLEPDDAGRSDLAEEEEPDHAQAVFAAMPAEIEGEAEDAGDSPEAPAGEAAAAYQAAFEETVRRLIRKELEGEFGERLSRNIRKIIREEVVHAMLRNR